MKSLRLNCKSVMMNELQNSMALLFGIFGFTGFYFLWCNVQFSKHAHKSESAVHHKRCLSRGAPFLIYHAASRAYRSTTRSTVHQGRHGSDGRMAELASRTRKSIHPTSTSTASRTRKSIHLTSTNTASRARKSKGNLFPRF